MATQRELKNKTVEDILLSGMEFKIFGSREIYFYLGNDYCHLNTVKYKKMKQKGMFIPKIWMDYNFYNSIRSIYDPKEKRQIAKRKSRGTDFECL